MKEFVTYPSQKREKSQDISKMKDDVIPEKSKRAPILSKRECRKIIMRKESQDIRLPNLSRIFFNFVKFFYQYPFTNSSRNIKNIFFSVHIKEIDSFLERKSMAMIFEFES
jgi:hypothetical protein